MAAKIVAVGQFDTRPLTWGEPLLSARAGQEKRMDFYMVLQQAQKLNTACDWLQTACANEANAQVGQNNENKIKFVSPWEVGHIFFMKAAFCPYKEGGYMFWYLDLITFLDLICSTEENKKYSC